MKSESVADAEQTDTETERENQDIGERGTKRQTDRYKDEKEGNEGRQ